MTTILKHNLDMAWETNPAPQTLKLKKSVLLPRPSPLPSQQAGPENKFRSAARGRRASTGLRRTDREVLRALRQAEMQAWETVRPTNADWDRSLRRQTAAADKAEGRLFLAVAVVSAIAIAEACFKLSALLNHWPAFTEYVSRLLG